MKPRQLLIIALLSAAMLPVASSGGQGQDLDPRLEFLAPLIGTDWVGHFVGSADSTLTHRVRWEAILDGRAVRRVKTVPQAGFATEGYYFWDWERGQVTFVSVSNRGQVTHGIVSTDEGRIVLRGVWRDGEGPHEFVLTLEVLADGRLRDRYENVIDGKRTPGHLIEYSAEDW
jgi:hypothetical protein